jgi:hypothetical protein
MRRLIFGSLAAGTFAFVLGCGSKQADSPPASQTSTVSDERKHDTDEKPSPSKEERTTGKQGEARIEANWESKLRYQADSLPTNCAVAGRVRFFREDKEASQEADGKVIIQLYDQTSPSSNELPPLEEWTIDAATVKFFLAANTSSPEYAFVLPWSTYTAEITQVRMEMKYEPKVGKTLSAKSDVLTLDRSEMKDRTNR